MRGRPGVGVVLHYNGGRHSRLGIETWHEARHRVALHLLGRLLRHAIQYRSARLRHDAPGGFDRARRAARPLFRRARLGDLSRLPSPPSSRPLSPPPPPPPPPPHPPPPPLSTSF